jgi:hypothetical protein
MGTCLLPDSGEAKLNFDYWWVGYGIEFRAILFAEGERIPPRAFLFGSKVEKVMIKPYWRAVKTHFLLFFLFNRCVMTVPLSQTFPQSGRPSRECSGGTISFRRTCSSHGVALRWSKTTLRLHRHWARILSMRASLRLLVR